MRFSDTFLLYSLGCCFRKCQEKRRVFAAGHGGYWTRDLELVAVSFRTSTSVLRRVVPVFCCPIRSSNWTPPVALLAIARWWTNGLTVASAVAGCWSQNCFGKVASELFWFFGAVTGNVTSRGSDQQQLKPTRCVERTRNGYEDKTIRTNWPVTGSRDSLGGGKAKRWQTYCWPPPQCRLDNKVLPSRSTDRLRSLRSGFNETTRGYTLGGRRSKFQWKQCPR